MGTGKTKEEMLKIKTKPEGTLVKREQSGTISSIRPKSNDDELDEEFKVKVLTLHYMEYHNFEKAIQLANGNYFLSNGVQHKLTGTMFKMYHGNTYKIVSGYTDQFKATVLRILHVLPEKVEVGEMNNIIGAFTAGTLLKDKPWVTGLANISETNYATILTNLQATSDTTTIRLVTTLLGILNKSTPIGAKINIVEGVHVSMKGLRQLLCSLEIPLPYFAKGDPRLSFGAKGGANFASKKISELQANDFVPIQATKITTASIDQLLNRDVPVFHHTESANPVFVCRKNQGSIKVDNMQYVSGACYKRLLTVLEQGSSAISSSAGGVPATNAASDWE